jgi:hypothetical protein
MPTDIAKALRAELSASQLDALVTRRENSLIHHYEEFVGEGEVRIDIDLKTVAAVRRVTSLAAIDGLLDRIATAVNNPEPAIDKAHIVSIIKNRLANFRHVEAEKNLDQRL